MIYGGRKREDNQKRGKDRMREAACVCVCRVCEREREKGMEWMREGNKGM